MRELPPEFKRRFPFVFGFVVFCAVVAWLSWLAGARGCEGKRYIEQWMEEAGK